jgi:hypothetical protein
MAYLSGFRICHLLGRANDDQKDLPKEILQEFRTFHLGYLGRYGQRRTYRYAFILGETRDSFPRARPLAMMVD